MRTHRELTAWTQALARGAYAAENLRSLVTNYAVDDPALPPAAAHLSTCLRDARDERWVAPPRLVSATVRGVLSELEDLARPQHLLDEPDVRKAWEDVCVAVDAVSRFAAASCGESAIVGESFEHVAAPVSS